LRPLDDRGGEHTGTKRKKQRHDGPSLNAGCSLETSLIVPRFLGLRRGGEAPADTTIFGDCGRLTQPAGTTICGGVRMVVCWA
jgi:hypothetical protein